MAKDSDDHGDGTSKGKDPESSRDEETQDESESAEDSDAEEDTEEEEDEEPKLKYARLTGHLGPVYRNGDATSAFVVAGDKMVCWGTGVLRTATEIYLVHWNTQRQHRKSYISTLSSH
jgi:hypothetical protein